MSHSVYESQLAELKQQVDDAKRILELADSINLSAKVKFEIITAKYEKNLMKLDALKYNSQ